MIPPSQSLVTKEEMDYQSLFPDQTKMVLPAGASLKHNFSKQHNITVNKVSPHLLSKKKPSSQSLIHDDRPEPAKETHTHINWYFIWTVDWVQSRNSHWDPHTACHLKKTPLKYMQLLEQITVSTTTKSLILLDMMAKTSSQQQLSSEPVKQAETGFKLENKTGDLHIGRGLFLLFSWCHCDVQLFCFVCV